MRILIIGSGAIGTMLGVKLSISGCDVTFHDHPEVLKEISLRGMRLKSSGNEYILNNVKTVDKDMLASSEKYDLAILCVKSYHTKEILSSIPKNTFSQILTIQNGVGNEEYLAETFGDHCILAGSITLPVAIEGPGRVEITNPKGGIGISSIRENSLCRELKFLFKKAGFDVRLYKNYREMKWTKLLLNNIANATSAILDMSPQEIFNDRRLTKIEKTAFLEGLDVMKAQNLRLVELPGYPVRIISIIFKSSPPTLLELIMSVFKTSQRGTKMPSLHIDLSSGSPHSEVEVLNGAIVRKAEELEIPTPVNKMLYYTLRGIVKKEIPWESFKRQPEKLWNLFCKKS